MQILPLTLNTFSGKVKKTRNIFHETEENKHLLDLK